MPLNPNAAPTGLPDDALEAARALTRELSTRMNIPGGRPGLLFTGDQIGPAAQVATALALADIAASLRVLAGRPSAHPRTPETPDQ